MAENVHFNIENSLQELEQLKRVGFFTDLELRKVIKKRKLLEYKVAKMMKRKEDYLKYIQYEVGLLALIRKKREKLRYFHKKSEIDNAIGKRISFLFKAAITRFPDDLKLWFSHHDFLKKMHWIDGMSNMHTQMLQIHNKTPALWVTCAKWEVEDNNSVDNARKLFQRGLRFHPSSELIWREYFRLELMYTDQILKRREVLGVDSSKSEDIADDSILKGQVAVVVYKKAVEVIQGIQFALAFLPVCKDFDFTNDIEDMIYSDIQTRFPDKEETWDSLAKRCFQQKPAEGTSQKKFLQSCIASAIMKYEEFCRVLPTEKMWDCYIQFLLDKIQESNSEKKMRKLLESVLSAMEDASEAKLLSLKMHIEWIRLLYSNQELKKACSVAVCASTLFPGESSIWQFCLTLHAQTANDDAFLEIFYKSIENVPQKNALPLWQVAIEWSTCNKTDHLNDILEKGLLQGREVQVVIKQRYLELTALLIGVDETRNLYRRLRKMPPLSLEFFETMVAVEKSQLEMDVSRIRKCYEDAIAQFGNFSVDLWLNYTKFENENPENNGVAAGKIYWRAMKQLKPELSDEFLQKHTLQSSIPLQGKKTTED